MKNRPWVWVIVFLVLSLCIDLYYYHKVSLSSADDPWQICYSDFKVFYTTAREFYLRFLNDPAYGPVDKRYGPIYDFTKEFYHFRYSPFVVYLFMPLCRIPMGVALLVWTFILNILFLMSFILLAKVFGDGSARTTVLLSIACVAVLRFYFNNIALGQTDAVIAFLWCLFLYFFVRELTVPGAVTFALIVQFKPFFLPVLAYFILSKRWRLALYSVLAFEVFLFIPVIKTGYAEVTSLAYDWARMINSSIGSQIGNPKNQSLVHFILQLTGRGDNERLVYLVSGVSYLVSLSLLALMRSLVSKQDRGPFRTFEVSFFLLAVLLSSPLIWKAAFISAIIPVSYILFSPGRRIWRILSLVFLALFIVFTSMLSPDMLKIFSYKASEDIKFIPIGASFLFISLILLYLEKYHTMKVKL